MVDPSQTSFDPVVELTEIRAATEGLISSAGALTDAAVRAASLLPGWTRGHVLAHVALNADGLINLLSWGRSRRRTPMYPSTEARTADIDAGATLPLPDLLDGLHESAARFERAVTEMPPDAWVTKVRIGVGGDGPEIPTARVLWQRRKEVEIHHVDLDAGYAPEDWPADFVSRALAETCRMFGRRVEVSPFAIEATDTGQRRFVGEPVDLPTVSGSDAALLAWLTGRSDGAGLRPTPAGPLPAIPHWA